VLPCGKGYFCEISNNPSPKKPPPPSNPTFETPAMPQHHSAPGKPLDENSINCTKSEPYENTEVIATEDYGANTHLETLQVAAVNEC